MKIWIHLYIPCSVKFIRKLVRLIPVELYTKFKFAARLLAHMYLEMWRYKKQFRLRDALSTWAGWLFMLVAPRGLMANLSILFNLMQKTILVRVPSTNIKNSSSSSSSKVLNVCLILHLKHPENRIPHHRQSFQVYTSSYYYDSTLNVTGEIYNWAPQPTPSTCVGSGSTTNRANKFQWPFPDIFGEIHLWWC